MKKEKEHGEREKNLKNVKMYKDTEKLKKRNKT